MICFSGNVFGVRKKNLDIWLHSYSMNVKEDGIRMDKILEEIKNTYGYEESALKDQMKFDTIISIEDKKMVGNDYKYSIKIRRRK